MNSTPFYIVRYKSGGPGCPAFLHGEHSPDRYEWNVLEPITAATQINNKYSFTLTDPSQFAPSFDFYGKDSWYVSEEFLDVCRNQDVAFRAVPLKMLIRGPGFLPTEYLAKRYSIFLPCEDVALLDRSKGRYVDENVLETGEPMMNKFHPEVPIYAEITHFVPRQEATPALFRCIEIFELVCTEAFMKKAQAAQLQGIEFVPLDDNYRYDAWG